MALPNDNRQLADVAALAVDSYLPGLIDLFFNSNPLWIRMASKERVSYGGGDLIRQPILYDKLNASSYSGFDTFDITRKNTKTVLQFDWSQYQVTLTVDGRTLLKTSGTGTRIMDLVETEMETARMTLAEELGADLFLDGTGNGSKDILGLIAAVDNGTNVATYGGISRTDGSAQATAITGNLNTTGGALSLPLVNTAMGSATIQPQRPDIIVTTQTLWDRFWERSQPAQREPSGPGFDDLARVGFTAINFNGSAVVVDSHVASGNAWLLNTETFKLLVHEDRDFVFAGFQKPTNQDAMVGQIFWAGQLICQSPRLNCRMTGLT